MLSNFFNNLKQKRQARHNEKQLQQNIEQAEQHAKNVESTKLREKDVETYLTIIRDMLTTNLNLQLFSQAVVQTRTLTTPLLSQIGWQQFLEYQHEQYPAFNPKFATECVEKHYKTLLNILKEYYEENDVRISEHESGNIELTYVKLPKYRSNESLTQSPKVHIEEESVKQLLKEQDERDKNDDKPEFTINVPQTILTFEW